MRFLVSLSSNEKHYPNTMGTVDIVSPTRFNSTYAAMPTPTFVVL